MFASRKAKTAVIAVMVLIGGSVVVYSLIPAGTDYILGHGFCYISDAQGSNGNSSYLVEFHGVNFTFLYWYWPLHTVTENLTAVVAEQRVQVYVQMIFSDGYTEIICFEVNSPGSCLVGPDPALQIYSSDHSMGFAAVATANTDELQSNWVYIVAA